MIDIKPSASDYLQRSSSTTINNITMLFAGNFLCKILSPSHTQKVAKKYRRKNCLIFTRKIFTILHFLFFIMQIPPTNHHGELTQLNLQVITTLTKSHYPHHSISTIIQPCIGEKTLRFQPCQICCDFYISTSRVAARLFRSHTRASRRSFISDAYLRVWRDKREIFHIFKRALSSQAANTTKGRRLEQKINSIVLFTSSRQDSARGDNFELWKLFVCTLDTLKGTNEVWFSILSWLLLLLSQHGWEITVNKKVFTNIIFLVSLQDIRQIRSRRWARRRWIHTRTLDNQVSWSHSTMENLVR